MTEKIKVHIIKAIRSLNPTAQVVIQNEDIDTIRWDNGTPEIAKADILAKQTELQAEYDAQEYARKRKAEYPSVQDLVVALYDTDDKTAIDEKRAAVKLKYPKP